MNSEIDSVEKVELSFRERIAADEGFNNKRKLLMIVSMLVILIAFTGASLKEANTFIFKIEFENSSGLNFFLFLSIILLLVRYYSFANEYQDELSLLWKSNLLKDERVLLYNKEEDSYTGYIGNHLDFLVSDVNPYDFRYEVVSFEGRCFVFSTPEHQPDSESPTFYTHDVKLNLIRINTEGNDGFFDLSLFLIEMKFRLYSYFNHRECLEIIAPYLMGGFALIVSALNWN